MACKLRKCFMKILSEVITAVVTCNTNNDCFKDLADAKLDRLARPAAVALLPHPPGHQLHAAQRDIRPPVTHRSEETPEVETLHHNSSHCQALCEVINISFFFHSSLSTFYFQQLWVSFDEEKLHRLDLHLGKTYEITNV